MNGINTHKYSATDSSIPELTDITREGIQHVEVFTDELHKRHLSVEQREAAKEITLMLSKTVALCNVIDAETVEGSYE